MTGFTVIYTIQKENNTDQTLGMCRQVCAFVVYIQQSQGFLHRGPYVVGTPRHLSQ